MLDAVTERRRCAVSPSSPCSSSSPRAPRGAEPLETALARFAAGHERELGPAAFTACTVAGCGEARHLASPALADPATGPLVLVLDPGATRPDVVILFHGLSDSPLFMCGLARAFFAAGASVVLPLLTGHGLAEPLPAAHGPELAERWKADAEAALAFARTRGGRISAGRLSTGGVLAVWLERRHPELADGGLFLFSAAFDFARRLQLAALCSGTVADRARNPLGRWCRGVLVPLVQAAERGATWRGRHPFRMRFSQYGALELGLLRRATLQALANDPLDAPLFVAHSTADTVAPIAGVDRLTARHAAPARVTRFVLDDARAANCRALTSDCERPAGLTPHWRATRGPDAGRADPTRRLCRRFDLRGRQSRLRGQGGGGRRVLERPPLSGSSLDAPGRLADVREPSRGNAMTTTSPRPPATAPTPTISLRRRRS